MNSKTRNVFGELLPPLSTEEFEALRADIRAHGVRHPVLTDEDGNVLDGRHRLKIDPKAPRQVITGLTPAEKEAFVFRANFVRRNLSPDQKREARAKMKATARKLRQEDAKKWTQEKVARELGIARETVRDWFTTNGVSAKSGKPSANGHASTTPKATTEPKTEPAANPPAEPEPKLDPKPDARVKLTPAAKEAIFKRVKAGESQKQVAADFSVSQQQVSKIVKAEQKKAEAKREQEEAAAKIKGDNGVIHGDFRKGTVAPGSVDLIFTDPPYDADAVKLYEDLAKFGANVLRPGGWLLAYSGHAHLPAVFSAMTGAGLEYAWTFAILHSGGDLRFRKYKLMNGWKPIVAFYRPPLAVTWDWFKDVVTGGKEKALHDWQQAESEAAHFIDHLSSPQGFVCDPFTGSGTTLAAAKRLGRRWLGFEIDAKHVGKARVRLA